MSEITVIRDINGKLVGYNGNDIIALEVLLTRYEGRVERIESNLCDVKACQNSQAESIKIIEEKTTALLSCFHEMTMGFNAVLKSNAELVEQCRQNSEEAIKLKTGVKIFIWLSGIAVTLGGLYFSAKKYFGG
jgi:predicted transcriptional regulator